MNFLEILDRQMHFVCGKGGVGKSTLACVLADYFAKKGERVLLVQINATDSHSQLFKCQPIGPQMVQIGPSLWALNAEPQSSLDEYVILKLRSKQLYKVLLGNSLARSFLEFLPSLSELTMIGKIWYHAKEKEGNEAKFSRIVVDCPATGHGLHFLKVAQKTYETIKIGPIAHEALEIADYIKNPQKSAVHIVTLPEELPISESIDLAQKIKEEKLAPLGFLLVNGVLENSLSGHKNLALVQKKYAPESPEHEISTVLMQRFNAESEQEKQLLRLKFLKKLMPLLQWPLMPKGELAHSSFKQLSRIFSEQVRGEKE